MYTKQCAFSVKLDGCLNTHWKSCAVRLLWLKGFKKDTEVLRVEELAAQWWWDTIDLTE